MVNSYTILEILEIKCTWDKLHNEKEIITMVTTNYEKQINHF